jgi:exodeoxyribonuclease V alpha subunit
MRPQATAAVYTPRLDGAEGTLARDLRELLAAESTTATVVVDRAISWYQQRARIRLAPRQREALAAALSEKIAVITGGPGTGKTTLIRGVVEILGKKDAEVLLAAPTGRAAKRLTEATGLAAKTIHRLLEFNPTTGSFSRNRQNPLEADCLVLDEVSMLDVELAASLLEAVPPGCRLVLVGDADQLPSVGPGNVLADLIASQIVPVIRLDRIFRQAESSLIVVNAHRVNAGDMPELSNSDDSDFYFVARDDPSEAADLAIDFAARRIAERFKLDPVLDVQVLSPMHRGELGVTRLNERLQALLTPPGPELVVGWRRFRAGDKVMQVRNNYELDIFNGDLGRVLSLDPEERELVVDFDGRPVVIPSEDLDDVVPAYACTIHKSQGSEYPAVVIVLHHQHHVMLQRNLLYTAITRGRRLVVIVGSKRALARAVNNATVRKRYTLLAERLQSPSP